MKVIASALNVRSGPGTEYRVVGSLLRGATVSVVEQVGDWAGIEEPCGWVASRFLEADAKPAPHAAPSGLDEIRERFGEPGAPAASAGRVTLPAPLRLGWVDSQVTRVACHAEMEQVFAAVFGELHTKGLWPLLRTFDGIYNARRSRSSGKWSTHAWGIAVDLNAATNRMGVTGDMDRRIVEVFEGAGFTWGGRWSGKSVDPMHFQYARSY